MATGAAGNVRTEAKPAFTNPYAGHRHLSDKEQEVLGEYARLASTLRRIVARSNALSSSDRHAHLLNDLRILERKMGLVLTLFKASVWSLIQTHQDGMEQEQDDETEQSQDRSYTPTLQHANGQRY